MRPRVIRGRGGLCPGLPQSIVSRGTYLHFCYCHNITKPTQNQTGRVFDSSVISRAYRITNDVWCFYVWGFCISLLLLLTQYHYCYYYYNYWMLLMLVFLFNYFMHYFAYPLDDTVNTSITIPSFRARKGLLIILLSVLYCYNFILCE